MADLDGAPDTKTALERFVDWMPDDAILVSWSDNDERQIRKEVEAKEIEIDGLDRYLDGWIDCQKTFGEKMKTPKTYNLSEALIIADIIYEDGAHDALVDARNTAMLFAKMESETEFKISSYFYSEDDHYSSFSPFAKLLANYIA